MNLGERVRELLEGGDRDGAATAAIESLGPSILGYLRAAHDPDDADDVFQVWAEDVWRGIAEVRSASALRTWAYRLACNAGARFQRQAWRRRRKRLATSAASRLAASLSRSTPLARRDERLDLLGADLSAEDRTLLLLRLDLEMTWDEIAEVLGREGGDVSAAALRKRFERLKARLAELARRKGLLR